MKIAASQLALHASHTAYQRQEREESLRVWRGERPAFEAPRSDVTRISDAARRALAAARDAVPPAPTLHSPSATAGQAQTAQAQAIEEAQTAAERDPFLVLVRQIIEFLTGEKVRVFDLEEFSAALHRVEQEASAASEKLQAANTGRAGWGVEYEARTVREEFEQTRFSATGTIRTADGQEISFTLELEMTRAYREEHRVSLSAGDGRRKDPLVVNFAGSAVELAREAGRRFRFDLDGDGRAESLPLFASGSGYLALDWNGNGRIDSGQELFGPRTGQGFAELARLDRDGNGWIDAADPDFERLFVWTPASEGAGALRTLAELGIGALSLAHVATPFALRGEANRDLGQVRRSGLYLGENGRVGSVQEIDLTI
ncbi:MAG: VCBS repeat-containing protein [Rhodocyclaceae bacterium]|nr:VCBS repeat-containing protein [Rhodocyclaceae bacterium]